MRLLLVFLVPPVIGAIIGFLTNAVAIKMLFRPLNEVRLFGIRLPFTPGILPRQRKRLASSIGGMVERELLTAEIVKDRLAREEVREKVKMTVSEFTADILGKEPGKLFKDSSGFINKNIPAILDKAYPAFTSAISAFVNKDEIRRELESRGKVFLSNVFLQLNTFQRFFLSAGQYDLTLQEKMPEIIDELINNVQSFLKDEKVKKRLSSSVTGFITQVFSDNDRKIADILNMDGGSKEKLDNFLFEKLMAAADDKIGNILSSINVKALVRDRIDSLDMLRVERIILDVMADQFKWINVFGAIVGFLIGSFQTIFNFLLK